MTAHVVPASLIATVLNEADSIVSFLESIAQQSAVPAEIVIVDGGSSDQTAELASSWCAPDGCEVVVIVSPGAGISAGRNIAITAARHPRILVADAGTELDQRWVASMYDSFDSAGGADVVSGFFYPAGSSFIQRTIAFVITPRLGEINPAVFLPSSRSIAFTKVSWQKAGGYPEWLDYCEDLVYDMELNRTGARFVFRPDAEVSWSARPTIRAFAKQYYRYARGDGKAGLWRKRHAARYGAYTAGFVLAAGSVLQPWLVVPLLAGFSYYIAKFEARVWRRRRDFGPGAFRALAMVPVVVVAGDVAKMAGYPKGVQWRLNRDKA